VPNIQNAWLYVCQNECNRAIEEAINCYNGEMQTPVAQAKDLMD